MSAVEAKSLPFPWPEPVVADFCRRWQIARLEIFGSALREDFRPDSDVDLLVDFSPGARWGLFAHARMEGELEEILGRRVDLVTRLAIEESPNWIRRKEVLASAREIYAA